MRAICISLIVLCAAGLAAGTRAAGIVERFDQPLPAHLKTFSDPGFTLRLDDGDLVLAKAAGVRNGRVFVGTRFALLGDFLLTVDMTGSLLNGFADVGLGVSFTERARSFAAVYAHGPGQVASNITVPEAVRVGTVGGAATEMLRLQIARTGNTLSLSHDSGQGGRILASASHALLAGPVTAELFLLQDLGSAAAHAARFDNLAMTAGAFSAPIPEPATGLLCLAGLVVLSGRARRRQPGGRAATCRALTALQRAMSQAVGSRAR